MSPISINNFVAWGSVDMRGPTAKDGLVWAIGEGPGTEAREEP